MGGGEGEREERGKGEGGMGGGEGERERVRLIPTVRHGHTTHSTAVDTCTCALVHLCTYMYMHVYACI